MVAMVVRRRVASGICGVALLTLIMGCRPQSPPSRAAAPETIARTEFTDRIENFFEYEPLVPGQPSAFLIHLTDLADGSPVERADVTLTVRPERAGAGVEIKAKVGRVTGIYVAHVAVPTAGRYTVEFRVKTAALDERMTLADFATGRRP